MRRRIVRVLVAWAVALALPLQAVALLQACAGAAAQAVHAHGGAHAMGGDDGATPHHCSPACAACCVGAALIPSAQRFAPVLPATGFARPRAAAIAPFLTGGIERPPRPLLA